MQEVMQQDMHYDQEQIRIKKLEELIELNTAISSHLEYEQVLQSIIFSAIGLLQADHAEVWREGPVLPGDASEDRRFYPVRTVGTLETIIPEQGIALTLPGEIAAGQPHEEDLDRIISTFADLDGTVSGTSVYGVFFHLGGGRTGLFTTGRESGDEFTREDRYYIERLARQAGISLTHSRKFSEVVHSRDRAIRESGVLRDAIQFVGSSLAARNLMQMISQVSRSSAPVLIQGERGTGKELVAAEIQRRSNRYDAPFIKVNCGAIVESLMESELFGYEKGAFTGAERTRKGLLEEANGGTVFLDEIGELNESMQVKLLRFLQEGTIRRIGGKEDIYLDVRVIAASNQNITGAGGFRRDLFDRLATIVLYTPPLRERREDIVLLANHFLQVYTSLENKTWISGLEPELIQFLEEQPWEGNVRELENTIHRLVIFHRSGNLLSLSEQPYMRPLAEMDEQQSSGGSHRNDQEPGLSEAMVVDPDADQGLIEFQKAKEYFEEHYVRIALQKFDGNISRAARAAGLDRGNFKLKMRKYGIKPQGDQGGRHPETYLQE